MLRAVYFGCSLPQAHADALNRESGRLYSQVLVEHYRIYRKKGIWLSPEQGERLNDFYNRGQAPLLHAHSIDAAQQGFYKACKTAKANREQGAKYPRRRKHYRTTVWKNTAIRRVGDQLVLALARGRDPICIELPLPMRALKVEAFREARLVYNVASRRYEWHLVIEDGLKVEAAHGGVAAVDLGEIHPATLTDGREGVIVSCRKLRSQKQHTFKQVAKFHHQQAQHTKGSRRWQRLQRRKNRFLAKQERRQRDIEHKVSRAVVKWAVEHQIAMLAIGDVRDIGDGKRLRAVSQQKISSWSHGKLRRYITDKAKAVGITVDDKVDEYHTSQAYPFCSNRHKPQGRTYRCANPACGAVVHRDVVGATNILSRFVYGELGRIAPPEVVQVSYPVRVMPKQVMRSSGGHPADSSA